MTLASIQTPAPGPEPDVDQAAWDADNRMFGREDAEPEAATPVEDWFTPTAPVVEYVTIDPASANWAPAIALSAALDAAVEPEIFACRECGDEHPVVPGENDSLWCECGARLDDQRARIADEAHTA